MPEKPQLPLVHQLLRAAVLPVASEGRIAAREMDTDGRTLDSELDVYNEWATAYLFMRSGVINDFYW